MNRSQMWWFAPWRIVRLSQRRCIASRPLGPAPAPLFFLEFCCQKKKKKNCSVQLFLCKTWAESHGVRAAGSSSVVPATAGQRLGLSARNREIRENMPVDLDLLCMIIISMVRKGRPLKGGPKRTKNEAGRPRGGRRPRARQWPPARA